ncbi:septum formation family protein [Micromonospora psammae]|uniref:septum formation family protein n=1 Tax=Micromonospora sp. CPCC 205556 TaxID=3122398 RepID=UPI002FF0EC46
MTRERSRPTSTEEHRPAPPGTTEPTGDEWEPWARPEQPRGRLSRWAVATFLLGLLGGVLAPIAGAVALRRIARTDMRGRGLAVAGLLLAGVWALALVLVWTQAGPRVDPAAGVRGLRLGECFRAPNTPTGTPTAPDTITEVRCTEPHDAEMIGDFPAYERYADEPYPGTAVLSRRAEATCGQRQRSYVLDPLSLPTDVRLRWYVPSRVQWASAPKLTCYLAVPASLTRPLRADATVLRPEQLAYLTAARDYTELRADLVARAPSAPVTELREAVRRIEVAHTRMGFQLRAGSWPEPARAAVATLIAGMEQAEPAWRDAEKAAGRDDLLKVVTEIQRHPAPEVESAVRQALGLPVQQGDPVR